jgi:RHS repeat-associated protein
MGRRKTNQESLSGQATLGYTYSYDALDRLTQVQNGTTAQTQSFSHDVYGNRVQKQIGVPATSTTAYKHDAANQLTEVHQTNLSGTLLEAYLYDNAGQQTKKCSGITVTRTSDTVCAGSTQNQTGYDSFNRLNQVQVNAVTTGSFKYDDQGRRTQKTEGATVINYHYDGSSIYAEYPGSGWTTANAVYVQAGTDHPLARLTGNVNLPTATAQYYHQDGQGSVLATTNAAKAVTAAQRFDAYGSKIGGTGTVPQYGYTGREPDASGLTYYRARYYDPNQTRFTQRDPLGYVDGLNRYAYVHNSPVNLTDPTGLNALNPLSVQFASQNGSYYASNQSGAGIGGISTRNSMLAFGATASAIGAEVTAGSLADSIMGMASRAAASPTIGALLLPLSLSGDTRQDRTEVYVTYTRTNPVTNDVYSGRTSGFADETVQQILNRRAAGQPLLNSEGFSAPVLDQVSTDSGAIRGREQQLIDYNGGAQSVGGDARNKINGVADFNINRPSYINRSIDQFGPLPDNSPSRPRFGPVTTPSTFP